MNALRLLPILLLLLFLAPSPLFAAPDEEVEALPESDAAVPEDTVPDTNVPDTKVPETMITATRTKRSIETLSGAVEVKDRDELDLMDAITVEQAMSQVAGVDVIGDSRYGQEVRFNTRGVASGFGTQRTLILLDGRPLTGEYLGRGDDGDLATVGNGG